MKKSSKYSRDRHAAFQVRRMSFDPIEGEEWRVIPGFPNYQASNMGRILGPRSILKPSNHPVGYLIVSVKPEGGGPKSDFCKTVHSLIAMTFLGPRPEGFDVAHADHDKTNNVLTNLSYMSHIDNIRTGSKNGTIGRPKVKWLEYLALENKDRRVKEIAKELGCSKETIYEYQKNFKNGVR